MLLVSFVGLMSFLIQPNECLKVQNAARHIWIFLRKRALAKSFCFITHMKGHEVLLPSPTASGEQRNIKFPPIKQVLQQNNVQVG